LRYLINMVCLLILGIPFISEAGVDLELIQGRKEAIQLAVVPFAGNTVSTELLDLAAVVNADLKNSGRFSLLDRMKMKEQPQTANEVNANDWRTLGMDDLVVGNLKPVAGGKYHVSFQLLDLYSAKSIYGQNKVSLPLLAKEFLVPPEGMRKLAHHISDLIYEKLTGEKGIFSTHLTYVVVEKSRNIPVRYHLQVADMDGYNPKDLIISSEPIMSPSWAPDGHKIAYVSFEKKRPGIYIQDIATGKRRLVTDYPGINGAPSWSKDASKLAFTLSKGGSPSIYTLDLVTNALVQRTNGEYIDTEPSWSPDGRSLIFTSNRSGGPQIYRVDLATGDVRRVTYEGNYNASATFFPDGKNLILLHQESGAYHIAIQNLQTGKVDILTETNKDQSPSIAPNGSMVVFATKAGSTQILSMVSTDARVQLHLPVREGDAREPDWSPF
jgi:TolB protein